MARKVSLLDKLLDDTAGRLPCHFVPTTQLIDRQYGVAGLKLASPDLAENILPNPSDRPDLSQAFHDWFLHVRRRIATSVVCGKGLMTPFVAAASI